MSTLIDRLSKLDAPDREVDAEIAFATGHFDYKLKYGFENCRIERGQNRTNDWVEVFVKDKGTLIYSEPYPHVTASVDAAIALAERVLPGWTFEHIGQDYIRARGLDNDVMPMGWTVEISDGSQTIQGQAPTLPLAICIALLRAKEASKL